MNRTGTALVRTIAPNVYCKNPYTKLIGVVVPGDLDLTRRGELLGTLVGVWEAACRWGRSEIRWKCYDDSGGHIT